MQLASGEAAAFFWIGGTRENKMVSAAVSGPSNSKRPGIC
jgi:hypothetical protein